MRILLLFLCAAMLPGSGPARAQQNAVVLELFTSQGCSACPPADALLRELGDRPGVVALALHVDYWDYLGWTDSFGHAAFTSRQRAYNKMDGRRSVYTPQMVVQGSEMFIGHDAPSIERSIRAHRKLPPPIDLAVAREDDRLTIAITPRVPLHGPIDIHVVHFIPSVQVEIEAGENAGRTITYSRVATEWNTVARWDGHSPIELVQEDDQTGQPVAVIVQHGGIGSVLSAAKLP